MDRLIHVQLVVHLQLNDLPKNNTLKCTEVERMFGQYFMTLKNLQVKYLQDLVSKKGQLTRSINDFCVEVFSR